MDGTYGCGLALGVEAIKELTAKERVLKVMDQILSDDEKQAKFVQMLEKL